MSLIAVRVIRNARPRFFLDPVVAVSGRKPGSVLAALRQSRLAASQPACENLARTLTLAPGRLFPRNRAADGFHQKPCPFSRPELVDAERIGLGVHAALLIELGTDGILAEAAIADLLFAEPAFLFLPGELDDIFAFENCEHGCEIARTLESLGGLEARRVVPGFGPLVIVLLAEVERHGGVVTTFVIEHDVLQGSDQLARRWALAS